jgi:large subunit ribosomal protein L18
MVVNCSNSSTLVQVIDDSKGVTVVSSHSIKEKSGGNIEAAKKVGEDIAKKATAAKVKTVIFDRNGHKFHGRVKALAEAARAGGLSF